MDKDRVKKFKQDICSVVGHDMSKESVRCDRCEALNLEGALRNYCDRYVGMKNTSKTYDAIRIGIEATLERYRLEEEITDWGNVTVQRDPLNPNVMYVSANVRVPWHNGMHNVEVSIW